MRKKIRFGAALAALSAMLGSAAALLWLTARTVFSAAERQVLAELFSTHAGPLVLILLVAMAGFGMAFVLLHRRYVLVPLQMREQLAVMLDANPSVRLPGAGPREMRRLAEAINQLADRRDALAGDFAARIAEATARAEAQKNRFAALLAQFSQSVIVCNANCRILLYNARAHALFQEKSDGPALIGLGRSIFGVIEPSLIAHGQEKIRQRLQAGDEQPQSTFIAATRRRQLIRVLMTPVMPEADAHVSSASGEETRRIDGYILILDDVTRHVELESQRDRLLQSLTEGTRASLANIRAAIENLSEYPDMDAQQRERFTAVVRDEAQVTSRRLERTLAEFSDALKTRWPLEEMLGLDLIETAAHRIEQRIGLPAKIEEAEPGLWLKVDSFSLLQGIAYLAARLKDEFRVRELRFRLGRSGRLAFVDVIWSGAVIGSETLTSWELEPMQAGGESTPLSLREIIERHDGELWFQRDKLAHRACVRLLLPTAEAPSAPSFRAPLSTGRPEYYDFDLFAQIETSALDDLPLSQLAYTVFDTETTGLEPSAGDEIIQIGAVRIVNGRLLKGEIFEQLIDPQRPVSPASTRIHGISREILAGQPPIAQVLPAFHAFCADTVLVAHNAAFDMRFLQMKEKETGVAFRQPVLDTLLLSALIHPHQESHALEAIAERLGVQVVGRHTALGDALVTGEVLLKMIPLLAEQGIDTLRQARDASARTYYAKLGY